MPKIPFLAAGVVAVVLAGCAAQRPVLYPNAKYKQAGPETAQRDVDGCMQLAEQNLRGSGERAVSREARGTVASGSSAAVGAAMYGDNLEERPAPGAAAGSTAGDTPYRAYVQRCLRERGYDVIDWQ
jgi:surface antigen